MGLTNKKEEQLRRMPIVEAKVVKSKDGNFLVHRTIITDIKPLKYYQVVLESKPQDAADAADTADSAEEAVEEAVA